MSQATRTAREVLLEGLIDYAGLFPPAALDVESAVRAYLRHQQHAQAFMLGRFVVPAARLADLAASQRRALDGVPPSTPWRLAALATPHDVEALRAFNRDQAGWAVIDTVEAKAGTAEEAARAAQAFGAGVVVYVEIPTDCDFDAILPVLARHGARAKVRTGGLTADLFPSSDQLAGFMTACARHGIAFKATAGLHHPLRGEHAMDGTPDGERAVMHGFLNVFLAAALLREGASPLDVRGLIDETDPSAFVFDVDAVRWRDRRIGLDALREARAVGGVSFGSCSFDEPCDDLRASHLL